ncbi:hypothetical protein Tsubulata_003329 [Turnera subulata]|uniref:Uncharacterized protein n=1 Tax=Turnera subulata TaxID=218843 RepID=A0A9Q0JN21_9ROSI|nr:hypothetical protein Tsubulata_003329 [Turnera subulata]
MFAVDCVGLNSAAMVDAVLVDGGDEAIQVGSGWVAVGNCRWLWHQGGNENGRFSPHYWQLFCSATAGGGARRRMQG